MRRFRFLPGLQVSFTTLLSLPFAFSTFPLFKLFLHFFQFPALSLFAKNILATVVDLIGCDELEQLTLSRRYQSYE